jgi:hypothetical protein
MTCFKFGFSLAELGKTEGNTLAGAFAEAEALSVSVTLLRTVDCGSVQRRDTPLGVFAGC